MNTHRFAIGDLVEVPGNYEPWRGEIYSLADGKVWVANSFGAGIGFAPYKVRLVAADDPPGPNITFDTDHYSVFDALAYTEAALNTARPKAKETKQ